MNGDLFFLQYLTDDIHRSFRLPKEHLMPIVQLPNLKFAYEVDGDGIPLLMIMGVGGQLVQWPPDFCEALIAQGFSLIRPDNRDVGLSEQFDAMGVPNTQSAFLRQAIGLSVNAPYTLEDMVEDHIQLLDHLNIETCHILGISMGSMIAQILAAKYPDRVQTVTLMHTNTGKLRHGIQTKPKALRALLKRSTIDNADDFADYFQYLFSIIGSPNLQRNPETLKEAGRALYVRGYHRNGFKRQFAAIMATGDREVFYRNIIHPTVVIHGRKDPLLCLAGAQAVVEAIPNATGHYFDGLGHDIPSELVPEFVSIIRELVDRVVTTKPSTST